MNYKFLIGILLFIVGIVVAVGFYTGQPQQPPEPVLNTPTPTLVAATNTPTAFVPLPTATVRDESFYVAPAGNNVASGSIDQPWLTIQSAVDKAQPGDTIYVRAGTYSEKIVVSVKGTAEKPIVLAAYPGEVVTIVGGPEAAITAYGENWVFSGLTLESTADRTLHLAASNLKVFDNKMVGAVYIWGHNNLFENNDVDGSKHVGNENGVMDDGPESYGNVFRNNKVHDFNLRGFWSQWLTHDDLFEGNQVYNITGDPGICIDMDGATSVEYRHIIRGNYVHHCNHTGIELENSYDTRVENNLIHDTGLEAIQVISYQGCTVGGENNQYGKASGDCRGDLQNVVIQQNVIYQGGQVGAIVAYAAAGVKVYNNTVYGDAVSLYLLGPIEHTHSWDVQGNIFADAKRVVISLETIASLSQDQYNLIYYLGTNRAYELRDSSNAFYTLKEWQKQTGLGQNSIETNPRFVDPAANDFRLKSNSQAIDAGPALGIETDVSGNPRPQGAANDMGAYEQAAQ